MSQIVYRGNLSAASFPFLAETQGRSIIVPQYDNAYVPQIASAQDKDKDRGIPQIYYCHNVLPTQAGFQSVGYNQVVNAFAGSNAFEEIYLIRDIVNRQVYIARDTTTNKLYYLKQNAVDWVFLGTFATAGLITVALVEGTSYIFMQNVGCFGFDIGTFSLFSITLSGLDITTVIGLTSSFGYLIAWSATSIAWSSTIDPTDFVPSLTTGAGGGNPEGAQGALTVVVPHTLGFIIYTTSNAVAAVFSGNSRFPFNFRGIIASGGCSSSNLIAFDSDSGNHWAYTTSGLQRISMQQSQTVFPEVTDFISGKLFEDFDDSSLQFTNTIITSTMKKRLSVVSNRYLVISYGVAELTHAIVYDMSQLRWGKIKLTHTLCFEYSLLSPKVIEIPKDSIAFMQANGLVFLTDFSLHPVNSNGTLILGKFQYIRQRLLVMDAAAVENISDMGTFNLTLMTALNGKQYTTQEGFLLESTPLFRDYRFSKVGLNHSLLFQGSFAVSSVVLSFHVHGKR